MQDDFAARCRQELRRWINGGKISPDMMDEIRTRTLLEIADFARTVFPHISDEIIWQNERDIREHMESAQRCASCRWMPDQCPTAGNRVEIALQPDGRTITSLVFCSKRQIIGSERRKAG